MADNPVSYRKLDPARKNNVKSSRQEANHSVCRYPVPLLAARWATYQLLCNSYGVENSKSEAEKKGRVVDPKDSVTSSLALEPVIHRCFC
jgi:hypothetical protein